jgi:hypothetical protein
MVGNRGERRWNVRELTKSMLSFSWAMSMFGLKQMSDLLVPQSNAAGSFAAVARSAEDQLGKTARAAFRMGDNLQRGLVDLTFAFLTFGLSSPGAGQGGRGPGNWGPGGMGSGGMSSGCSTCSSTGASVSGAAQTAGDVTAQALGAGIDVVQQGVNFAFQMLGGSASESQGDTGWGPVPPPPGS